MNYQNGLDIDYKNRLHMLQANQKSSDFMTLGRFPVENKHNKHSALLKGSTGET